MVRNDRGGVVMASQGEPLVGMRSRHLEERDACAVVATIRSSGESTHGNLKRTLEALAKLGHRSGDVTTSYPPHLAQAVTP